MKVYVYLNDGFETAEALTPVDLMRRAGLKVLLVSLEDELTVKSAQDISVTADIMFEKADADIVGEDDLLLCQVDLDMYHIWIERTFSIF